ncbi:hypothetical protein B0H16DRAFT_1452681 [Mycena metata]|uniref:Uncharacterized protein n=1 Tax=Mycena metata TaxID=1033252 RepID=A0AAD7JPY9_9AGAR|nr:hypothetical protein B0H16DRAFT_1452681 [Mycena metata]
MLGLGLGSTVPEYRKAKERAKKAQDIEDMTYQDESVARRSSTYTSATLYPYFSLTERLIPDPINFLSGSGSAEKCRSLAYVSMAGFRPLNPFVAVLFGLLSRGEDQQRAKRSSGRKWLHPTCCKRAFWTTLSAAALPPMAANRRYRKGRFLGDGGVHRDQQRAKRSSGPKWPQRTSAVGCRWGQKQRTKSIDTEEDTPELAQKRTRTGQAAPLLMIAPR